MDGAGVTSTSTRRSTPAELILSEKKGEPFTGSPSILRRRSTFFGFAGGLAPSPGLIRLAEVARSAAWDPVSCYPSWLRR